MEKFECVYYDGCSFSTTINNKELVEFTENEIKTILKPILCWFAENSEEEDSLRCSYADFMQNTDEFLDLMDELSEEAYYREYDRTYGQFKSEYTIDKLKEAINNEKDLAILQMLYEEFLREFGEYTDFGHCEQCGSYNSEFKYIIEM